MLCRFFYRYINGVRNVTDPYIFFSLPPRPIHKHLRSSSHLPSSYTPVAALEKTTWYQNKSSKYFYELSTQPETLGYGLLDSPIGLSTSVVWTDSYL